MSESRTRDQTIGVGLIAAGCLMLVCLAGFVWLAVTADVRPSPTAPGVPPPEVGLIWRLALLFPIAFGALGLILYGRHLLKAPERH